MGHWGLIAEFVIAGGVLAQAQTYDLVLKGGHVIDPRNNVDAVRDVSIRGDRIAAVENNIAADEAKKAIDVSGLYVTPGLVDIHTHFYIHSAPGTVYDGDTNVHADTTCPRTCVTTGIDVGTVGWRAFPDFRRRIIDTSQKTRVLAMLNIDGRLRILPPRAAVPNYGARQAASG